MSVDEQLQMRVLNSLCGQLIENYCLYRSRQSFMHGITAYRIKFEYMVVYVSPLFDIQVCDLMITQSAITPYVS